MIRGGDIYPTNQWKIVIMRRGVCLYSSAWQEVVGVQSWFSGLVILKKIKISRKLLRGQFIRAQQPKQKLKRF